MGAWAVSGPYCLCLRNQNSISLFRGITSVVTAAGVGSVSPGAKSTIHPLPKNIQSPPNFLFNNQWYGRVLLSGAGCEESWGSLSAPQWWPRAVWGLDNIRKLSGSPLPCSYEYLTIISPHARPLMQEQRRQEWQHRVAPRSMRSLSVLRPKR